MVDAVLINPISGVGLHLILLILGGEYFHNGVFGTDRVNKCPGYEQIA